MSVAKAIDKIIDRVDRFGEAIGKYDKILGKLPRLIEMFGVSFFAGKASERLGGDFLAGALGGATADGLAHSNVPHNQIGGVALAGYFAGIGALNLLSGQEGGIQDSIIATTRDDCNARGGTVEGNVDVFVAGQERGRDIVFCRLPQDKSGDW